MHADFEITITPNRKEISRMAPLSFSGCGVIDILRWTQCEDIKSLQNPSFDGRFLDELPFEVLYCTTENMSELFGFSGTGATEAYEGGKNRMAECLSVQLHV